MISEKTLLVLKLSMYGSLAVITLISFVSMGVVGSNLTVWEEVETPDTLAILKKDHNMFFVTQQLVLAMDVVLLPFLYLLLFSTFRFYTKGNFIIIIIYSVFMMMRLIASFMFLLGYSSYRTVLEYSWRLFSNQYSQYQDNPACLSENCSESITYVNCAKVLMWMQAHNFQIAYAVLVGLLGSALAPLSFYVNKADVERGERQGKI